MRICCVPCYTRRGVLVTATNRGDVWRCEECAEAVAMGQAESDMASYHGGASWMGSAQIERAKLDGAMR